jgi:hypothetical protein
MFAYIYLPRSEAGDSRSERDASKQSQTSGPARVLHILKSVHSRQVSTAIMSPVHHSITHKALHAAYVRANVLVRKQMCRLIHPSITAAECIVFIKTIEDQLCDAVPLGGPNTCCHFETERKTQERDHVLVEDKDLSEARTEAAADHSYKLTTALAIAKGVLPDGAVAAIVPQGKLA